MPLAHPVGFSPAEISRRVNDDVVSRHAEEAAFLWTLRSRAVTEPHYGLKELARLDERIEAHVSGLRVSPDEGWRHCQKNLALNGAGELFAASVLAFWAGDRGRMREVLFTGCAAPGGTSGLISALGWLEHESVFSWIARLLQARQPLHRAVGLAACAIRREDPSDALVASVRDRHPALRARALRMVGEIKRSDLLDAVHACRHDEDGECRFWAAWTLALNRERAGVTALLPWFEAETPFTMPALQLGLRAMDIKEAQSWVSSFGEDPARARTAVMAAGIVGDPAAIPWLIRRMESSDLARLAGEAFTVITGVDLAYHDLDRDPPVLAPRQNEEATLEETVADLDYESNLRWPSAERVAEWWEKNVHAFTPGLRHLGGQAITPKSALDVLTKGKQRLRAAAALELALLNPEQPLFEVRARGDWQERALHVWNS